VQGELGRSREAAVSRRHDSPDLSQANPNEFVRRVKAAIATDAWVLDGDYGIVRYEAAEGARCQGPVPTCLLLRGPPDVITRGAGG
jgi:hypothetical protein